jgi:hypothetical protein
VNTGPADAAPPDHANAVLVPVVSRPGWLISRDTGSVTLDLSAGA